MNYTPFDTTYQVDTTTDGTNGDHTPTDVTTPAWEIIVRVTGTFIPASRNYVGNHRKA